MMQKIIEMRLKEAALIIENIDKNIDDFYPISGIENRSTESSARRVGAVLKWFKSKGYCGFRTSDIILSDPTLKPGSVRKTIKGLINIGLVEIARKGAKGSGNDTIYVLVDR